jgi:ubiquitin carboxyl-terminal hydrolase 10
MGFFLETLHEEMLYLFSRCEARMAKGPSKDSTKATTAKTEGADDEREVSRPVSPSAGRDDGWLEVGKKQKINVVRAVGHLLVDSRLIELMGSILDDISGICYLTDIWR